MRVEVTRNVDGVNKTTTVPCAEGFTTAEIAHEILSDDTVFYVTFFNDDGYPIDFFAMAD